MELKCLKITRKRTLGNYLNLLERFSLCQGFPSTKVNGLRWCRLQRCIDSIRLHLIFALGDKEF